MIKTGVILFVCSLILILSAPALAQSADPVATAQAAQATADAHRWRASRAAAQAYAAQATADAAYAQATQQVHSTATAQAGQATATHAALQIEATRAAVQAQSTAAAQAHLVTATAQAQASEATATRAAAIAAQDRLVLEADRLALDRARSLQPLYTWGPYAALALFILLAVWAAYQLLPALRARLDRQPIQIVQPEPYEHRPFPRALLPERAGETRCLLRPIVPGARITQHATRITQHERIDPCPPNPPPSH